MTPLLDIVGLRVRYSGTGRDALRGIDLALGAGERVAVIGESGSGKSTLALAIAGLLPRDAERGGSIRWPGLTHPPINGKDVGYVFQDAGASLNPVMTVGRQVAEVAKVHLGQDREAAGQRALDLFAQVHLPNPDVLLEAYPHQLSGGQRQRVGIAAAIAANPLLLIADEPTSALDMVVQAEIVRLIDALVSATGMSLLMVTHDIALAARIADRIVVLKDGAIVEQGPVASLVEAPRAEYTRSLLDACLTLADVGTTGPVPP
jgi:peptide/nickel transport system ATP-binding protein